MNFKELEKAHKILEKIQALDKDIIEIDRLALLIAGGEVKLELSLGITDLVKKADAESKVVLDEDGSLQVGGHPYAEIKRHIMQNMGYPSFVISFGDEKVEEAGREHYKASITENVALQILGVLLAEKHQQRLELMGKLKAMGVGN